MLVFIDDSGDPSFSIEKGSSRFFVIAAVIFDDDLVAEETALSIKKLKSKKESFYSYFIKMLLKHSKGTISNAKVRIDGSGDRIFRKTFLGYLKKELNQDDKKVLKSISKMNGVLK